MEVLQRTFCIETGKQNIKQLPEEPLSSVKLASERRQGNFFDTTQELKRDALVTASHHDFISTFTSKTHIERHLKKRRQDGNNEVLDSKKSRQSTETEFDFPTYCLFCGKRCQEKDLKHSDRWQKYYIVQSVYTAG